MIFRWLESPTDMSTGTNNKTFSYRLKKYSNQITLPSDDEAYNVEAEWTDLIEENDLSEDRCKQQQGVFEFIQTERNYILKIRAVQIYRQIFLLAQNNEHYEDLENIDSKMIFGNINEIFLTNDKIWTEFILAALKRSRETKKWIDPCQILAAFEKTEDLYKSYIDFCLQQGECVQKIREYTDTSNGTIINKDKSINDFITFLEFCETLPHCNSWKLADLMIEPMKRVTLYPLLLKAILKRTECKKEQKFLKAMIVKFEEFVSHINRRIRINEEDKKLQSCLDEFEEYDVWLAGNEEVIWNSVEYLRESIKLKEKTEQRCLLKRGQMKILENKDGKKKIDVEVLLFSDVLVLARYRKTNRRLTVVRQLYFLDKLILKKAELSGTALVLIYLNEAGLLSESLMLDIPNSFRGEWLDKFEKVKKIYIELKKGCGTTLDIFKESSRTEDEIDENDCMAGEHNIVHERLKANGVITSKSTTSWHLSKDGVKCLGNTCTNRKLNDQESKVSLTDSLRRVLSDSNILEEEHSKEQTSRSSGKKKYKRKDSKLFNSYRERGSKSKDKLPVQKKHSFDSRSSFLSLSPLLRKISSNSIESANSVDLKSLDDVFITDDLSNDQDKHLDNHVKNLSIPEITMNNSRASSLSDQEFVLDGRDISLVIHDINLDSSDNSLDGKDKILQSTDSSEISPQPLVRKTCSVGIQTEITFGNWFFHKQQCEGMNSSTDNINSNPQFKRTNSL